VSSQSWIPILVVNFNLVPYILYSIVLAVCRTPCNKLLSSRIVKHFGVGNVYNYCRRSKCKLNCRKQTRISNKSEIVRFEAFTAMIMKNVVFWDVALCRACVSRSFGGKYSLHLQGRKIPERESAWIATYSRWFPARGFFYMEDGGDTFLRNVG
jgi:hypothetical protein